MPRPMQGEAKPTCAVSRQQQITVLLLKAIHSALTLLGTLTPGEQLSADPLMKQQQRIEISQKWTKTPATSGSATRSVPRRTS